MRTADCQSMPLSLHAACPPPQDLPPLPFDALLPPLMMRHQAMTQRMVRNAMPKPSRNGSLPQRMSQVCGWVGCAHHSMVPEQ